MGWRSDEVWLETELLWFREQPRMPFGLAALTAPAGAADALEPLPFLPVYTGLEASRARRLAWQAARRRRFATRTLPAVALVVGSATMLPIAALRHAGSGPDAGPLQEDPPSLTFRIGDLHTEVPMSVRRKGDPKAAAARVSPRARDFASVAWQRATSVGLPYSGRLLDGTQLPVEGPDWVTWNPVTDSLPNRPERLYGNERTIRTVISVIAAYRVAHPDAPRVVVGDISRRDGGRMDEHLSHQNGLDVDVYYPRRDRHLRAPVATSQIDTRLAQDLLGRFVAAGAKMVFVGFSTGLRGPGGVVVPYPNHENHMHVRFPSPG
jgi:murein endopeptidase